MFAQYKSFSYGERIAKETLAIKDYCKNWLKIKLFALPMCFTVAKYVSFSSTLRQFSWLNNFSSTLVVYLNWSYAQKIF